MVGGLLAPQQPQPVAHDLACAYVFARGDLVFDKRREFIRQANVHRRHRLAPRFVRRYDPLAKIVNRRAGAVVFEPATGQNMDATMGINGTYLVAEYFTSVPKDTGKQPDLGRSESRYGLRFEF